MLHKAHRLSKYFTKEYEIAASATIGQPGMVCALCPKRFPVVAECFASVIFWNRTQPSPPTTTSPSLESNERRRERTIWASPSTRMGLEDMNHTPEHPSSVKSPRGCRRRRQHSTQPASQQASQQVSAKEREENSQEHRAVLVFSTAKIQPPDTR